MTNSKTWRSVVTVVLLLAWTSPAHAVVGVILDSWGTPLVKLDQVVECGNEAGDGSFQKSWPTGGTRVKGTCTSRLATDGWKAYHQNGQIEWKGQLAQGRFTGKFKSWYASGSKRAKGAYAAGSREGKFRYYHDGGKTKAKGKWAGDKEQGCWVQYHANGQKAAKGAYADGKKVGSWYYWDADGNRRKEKLGGEKTSGGCFLPLF